MGHARDDMASVHTSRSATISYRPLQNTSTSGFSDHWQRRRINIAEKPLDGGLSGGDAAIHLPQTGRSTTFPQTNYSSADWYAGDHIPCVRLRAVRAG